MPILFGFKEVLHLELCKRKEFALKGANSSLFEWTLFQKGLSAGKQTKSQKLCPLKNNGGKSAKRIQSSQSIQVIWAIIITWCYRYTNVTMMIVLGQDATDPASVQKKTPSPVTGQGVLRNFSY